MEQPGKRIRKIVWGIIPAMPTRIVAVGSPARLREYKGGIAEYVISEIVENKGAYWETGSVEFDVFVSKTKDSKDKLFWQRFTLRPELIEYEYSEENEEFLV